MVRISLLIIFTLIFRAQLFSQNAKQIFIKDFFIEDYKITITNNEVDYFSGEIIVTDIPNNREVFKADSIYTRYNWDTLIDLNNDGRKELILDLGTGMGMYDYAMFLIFDFARPVIDPVEIHNAELVTDPGESPKIYSYVRLSPAVLGAGYIYVMKYTNGNLVLENDMKSKVMKNLDSDGSDELYLINEMKKETDECAENSGLISYFEAYLMQQKLLNQEKKGWKFFDRYYKCKDKKDVRKHLRSFMNEAFSYLNNPDNFRINLNK